jgi:hypothetical protein
MIQKEDEFLHNAEQVKDNFETFKFNVIDKKSKVFGFADINYLHNTRKMKFNWAFFVGDEVYTYASEISYKGKRDNKVISDKKFDFKIMAPQEKFQLVLKNGPFSGSIKVTGAFPIYLYPTSPSEDPEHPLVKKNFRLWNRYEQRCRISGSINIAKGVKKKFECFGQREHSWGGNFLKKMRCCSSMIIQFKDMAMNLTYMEIDNAVVANGFISRRSGNIPIQNVGFELITFSHKYSSPVSTEFSYKDAQDDLDLIVSRKFKTIMLPLPENVSGKFIRFRNFSEFTIIGSSKKGVGMEEHLISIDKLKEMD